MKYLNAPFHIKALNEDGSFSGHASIFGNVDSQMEVVERGAFKNIVKNEDGKVVVLWQHNTRDPIGVADVTEDAKGLAFQGSLVLEDPTARKARAHMIAKSVRGMSIGYDTIKDEVREGIRYLKELKLYEISVVTFGANVLAGVDAVKSMESDMQTAMDSLRRAMTAHQGNMNTPATMTPDMQSRIMDQMRRAHSALTDQPPAPMKSGDTVHDIKEFEELLREVGFPRAAAKALAGGGWARLDGQREVDGEANGAKELLGYLSGLKFS